MVENRLLLFHYAAKRHFVFCKDIIHCGDVIGDDQVISIQIQRLWIKHARSLFMESILGSWHFVIHFHVMRKLFKYFCDQITDIEQEINISYVM
ncbi:hypothetical protein C6366_08600 [Desulfonatronum sp. SC1]|nr:hypothetical protein C6366_08600 [Desulfonatronum sp. SC1]